MNYISVLKTGLLSIVILLAGCQDEKKALESLENESVSIELKSGGALLEISYETTTYQMYHYDFETLDEFDLAYLNPSEEKEHVQMYIMPDGTVNITIEVLDFQPTINIPHETAVCDAPKIKRTEVVGNTITFYDGNNNILGTEPFEFPKQTELVSLIYESGSLFGYAEAARSFANMQGGVFDYEIERMITDARAKGQLTEYGSQYVTVRTDFSEKTPGVKGAGVVIIDRNINKIAASATYDEKENLTSRTFYGYEKKGAPILNATRTETYLETPSGAEVWQITMSKIDNLKFKLKN